MSKTRKLILFLLTCFIFSAFSFKLTYAKSLIDEITYWFDPKVIRIKNDDSLKSFIDIDVNNKNVLVQKTKTDYFYTIGSEIKISDTSLAVEIIGHIYPDKVARYLPKHLRDKILKHTEVIDCGEKDVDSNRWIWDSIASVLDYNKKSQFKNLKLNSDKDNSYIEIDHSYQSCDTLDDIIDQIIETESKLNPDVQLNRQIMELIIEDIASNNLDYIFKDIGK